MIKWNLVDDTFEHGQWIKGSLYVNRCDLSPNGEKLFYFYRGSTSRDGFDCFSALSKPPYFSALAIWPKKNCWGGGGLFESENTIWLNHREDEQNLGNGFFLGKNIKVRSCGPLSGYGEDLPIYDTRLIRDGWELVQEGNNFDYSGFIYEKKSLSRNNLALQMHIEGSGDRLGKQPTRGGDLITYEVLSNGESILKLPITSWADWDSNGDLLFTVAGKLFRLLYSNKIENITTDHAKEIADFSQLKFERKLPPKDVLEW